MSSALVPNLTTQKLEELKKDSKNKVYEYQKEADSETGVQYDPKIVVKRFRRLRKDFMKIHKERTDWSNEQCLQKLLLNPAYQTWKLFLRRYPKLAEFVLNKTSLDDTVTKYLDSASNALKHDKNATVAHQHSNKVDKNHPEYQQIMNRQNQAMAENLFASKLVTMKPKPDS